MLRWATSILLVSLLAFGVSVGAQQPSPDPSLGVSARVVRVDVVAEDEDGHPVRDLRREELVLSDDGREEPITSFAAPLEEPEAPPRHKELCIHREFDFACPAPGGRDGGVGSLVAERLRVVADVGLVKGHEDGG